MPIENRDLPAGTVLKARHKGKEHTCEVVKTTDGLRYRLKDGREFSSPSSAGKEITGGVAVNGWRFWSLDGDAEPPKAKAEQPEAKTSANESTKKAPAKTTTKSTGRKTAKTKSRGRRPKATSTAGARAARPLRR